jgi:hypothetical protein
MINAFPMISAGWVYQLRENAPRSSRSSEGNVAEKTVEVKALKFLIVVGGWLLAVGREFPLGRFETQPNPQPSTHSRQPTPCPLQIGAGP